jgi:DNA-3-methyladenine glycosylase I
MKSREETLERCPWTGIDDPLYARYHDEEWGVPHADDRRLFEKLVLEGFQAGLSWITILRKREAFRRAFHDFDARKIARYTERDVARLMADEGIVRNKLKILATIDNAKAFLALTKRRSLASFLWTEAGGKQGANARVTFGDVPAATDVSRRLSKALKREGFRFVGPTTVYAFMQATGMVNDHLAGCPRHAVCAKLQRAFVPPTT